MTITKIDCSSPLWERVIEYADTCSWFGGPEFAKEMRHRPFADWEKVFVAREGDEIAGYCALTAQDGFPELPYTPYVNSVFVGEKYRGHRLSETMIRAVENYAKEIGFTEIFLLTDHVNLYEKYGYMKIDEAPCPWERGKTESFYIKRIV